MILDLSDLGHRLLCNGRAHKSTKWLPARLLVARRAPNRRSSSRACSKPTGSSPSKSRSCGRGGHVLLASDESPAWVALRLRTPAFPIGFQLSLLSSHEPDKRNEPG